MRSFYPMTWKVIFSIAVCLLLMQARVNAQSISIKDALALVSKNAATLQLPEGSMSNFTVQRAYHDKLLNADLVYLQQTFKGIPVFQSIKTIAFRNGKVVSVAGNFRSVANNNAAKNATPAIADYAAIAAAARHLNLNLPQAKQPTALGTDEVTRRTKYDAAGISKSKITTELLWIPWEGKTFTLVKQVNIEPLTTSDNWLVNVDAANATVIDKINLTVYCDWGHSGNESASGKSGILNKTNNFQDQSILSLSNATYRVVPYPVESMNHPGGTPTLVTNPWMLAGASNAATTLAWHNDGTNDYAITRGNNVWAKEDRDGNNELTIGLSATSQSAAPDYLFDYPFNSDLSLIAPDNQSAAITNLFYWNNIVHDISYQYGFDEAAGNFQNDNLGRGGFGGDFVLADAQDGGGTNNANFSTPYDGTNGRMQMYLFNYARELVKINSPGSLAGYKYAVESNLSINNRLAANGPIKANVVLYDPANDSTAMLGCTPLSGAPLAGKIALIYRGNCTFIAKIKNAQNAGAIGVIMIQNTSGVPTIMGGTDNTITIPAVMISRDYGEAIRTALAGGNIVNATLNPPLTTSRDGDFDNGVIAHEYGHGISNRLTGVTCLANKEQMGEGWSDYYALMMTTDWSTATVTDGTISRSIGTYVVGRDINDFGIRTYPYTTNKAVNPWDYSLLPTKTNSGEVHAVGEIWTTALWDMTWNLIAMDGINTNLYNANGTGGNTVAMKLVNQGLKLQPCLPGFIDGRDAILKADTLLYNGKYSCAIWRAFAGRGMGVKASQGSSNIINDQVSDNTIPESASITKTADVNQVNQEGEITYTLKAYCQCSPITNYTLVDTLKSNVTYISGGIYDVANRTVKFTVASLAALDSVSFSVKVKVNNGSYYAASAPLNDSVSGSSIPSNFVAVTNSPIGSDNWTVVTDSYHSAPSSIKAVNTNYSSTHTLTTANAYNVFGISTFSFWHRYYTETGYDGGRVEISIDNGTSWTDAAPYMTQNGYNNNVTDVKGFSGNSNGFVKTVMDLTRLQTTQLKVRFIMFSDANAAFDGWYIDDIMLKNAAGVSNTVQLYNSSDQLQSLSSAATLINCSTTSDESQTACNSFTWHGKIYTSTGTYMDTTVNQAGCDSISTLHLTITAISGDPTVFGNNQWNVYAYNSGDGTFTGTDWSSNYSGYYTSSSLNINTFDDWGLNVSPSAALNYQGCALGNDNFSFSAKRQGFTCGYYSLDVPGHDDGAQLWINGSMVWSEDFYNPNTVINAWSGWLGANDKVEFRVTEGTGGAFGNLNFNLNSAITAGDPTIFGNNVWNVYAWNAGGAPFANNTNAWNTNYSGYYTSTPLNINTLADWNENSSPSAANNYQGCSIGNDNFSFSAKRQGFTCGYYSLDVPGHDDGAQLFVNGNKVWEHDACCDAHNGVWNGWLGANDKIEFRVTEGGGGSNGQLTFNLIRSVDTSTTAVDICSRQLPYSWNGNNYNTAGTYYATLTNASGCDSVARLVLSIRKSSTSEQTITRCGSYVWNGTIYTQSGDYNFSTTNANGCDSTALLHLFISSQDTLVQTVTRCSSITWNGYTYRKSGVYYYRQTTGGCRLVAVLKLTIPKMTSTVSVTNPLCSNNINGSLTVTANNGTAPYLYKNGLNGSYQSSGTFSGLFGATYRIYYQDANGCEGYTDSIILINPRPVSATTVVTSACNNTATGKITVTATGGYGPYKYKNGLSGTYQSGNVFSGLIAGTQYRIYVQDTKGCVGSASLVTMSQSSITASYTTMDATCYNTTTGTATITAMGGASPYRYKNGLNGAYQTSNVITGLRAGTQYRIYVQDANGCTGNTPLITVGQPPALTSTISFTPPTCREQANGSATITPTSGLAPYQYKYSSAGAYQQSNTFDTLSGGTAFRLYFRDATGCVGVGDQVTIPIPANTCFPTFARTAGSSNVIKPAINRHLEVAISPNPSNTQFTVIAHADNTQPITISVMDVNGRNLYQSKGQAEQSFRFGSSFAPGTYLVEVRQGDKVKTVKAVKMR